MSNTDTKVLSDEVKAIMDLAVRAAREQGYCHEFTELAGPVFGVPSELVVDNEGYNCRGYNVDGFDKDGYDNSGYNKEGLDCDGFDRSGYDKEGYDGSGYNREGLTREGGDKYCFDDQGYDQEGYDRSGYRRRARRDWFPVQAARSAEDFRFDRHGTPRPVEKKGFLEKLGF